MNDIHVDSPPVRENWPRIHVIGRGIQLGDVFVLVTTHTYKRVRVRFRKDNSDFKGRESFQADNAFGYF